MTREVDSGRLGAMMSGREEFCDLIAQMLRRFFAQNAEAMLTDAQMAEFATSLWALVVERGLPRPLAVGETGVPGEMSEAECAPLVARIALPSTMPLLADAARQLVKACFYPEFTTCRDSFCATTTEGVCRRQELGRTRKRISGAHCVDCPHWVGFEAQAHETFLRQHWRTGVDQFTAHRGVFLPEDFRALRRWLHAKAREPSN